MDTVNACLKGGADVRAVNARGEHCVGLARKARAKAGQRRGNSETATAEAAARREVAAQVAQLVDKKAAQGGAPPRISMGTPQKVGRRRPSRPAGGSKHRTSGARRRPSRRPARSTAGGASPRARLRPPDAVEAKVQGFVVEGDPDQMGERAVTATRTTLAEALACRGETSSDAELYARDLQVARRLPHLANRRGRGAVLVRRARGGPRGVAGASPGDGGRVSKMAEGDERKSPPRARRLENEATRCATRTTRCGSVPRFRARRAARRRRARTPQRHERPMSCTPTPSPRTTRCAAGDGEMARAWVKERGDTLRAYGRRGPS